jgi:hypothetical protein
MVHLRPRRVLVNLHDDVVLRKRSTETVLLEKLPQFLDIHLRDLPANPGAFFAHGELSDAKRREVRADTRPEPEYLEHGYERERY